MNAKINLVSLPWYREPWPWILMSGPFIVVVAGFITAYLAVISNDGLVSDDYYKQGLTVNQRTERDQRAITL
ncbi:MAG: FixH family protein, partial [Burkholderiaceae bacterium]|nr:FixH family protein [Burkholderiaceae bacterium]